MIEVVPAYMPACARLAKSFVTLFQKVCMTKARSHVGRDIDRCSIATIQPFIAHIATTVLSILAL